MKINFQYILYILLLTFALAFVSCNKEGILSKDMDAQQEVTFSTQVISEGEKCALEVSGVDYVLIQIDSVIYRPDIFVSDGIIYTQSIKLPPGSYTLNRFMMMNNNNTPSDFTDDIIILATPMAESDFSIFVNEPAGFGFDVDNLKKSNISIEVIYFNPADYDKFGFGINVLPATTIREQIFTGLLKPKNPADYAASIYINQSGGLQNEMPAIFTIDVFRNGRYVQSFGNESQFGESSVTVSYPDGDDTQDDFRFDLKVYLKIGQGYEYKYVKSWEFSDGEMIPAQSDGMVHFVIGECGSVNGEEGEIGPYLNLPASCNFIIKPVWAPGSLGTYFDVEISGIPVGYSMGNGFYSSWCGTDSVNININHIYEMDIYCSLMPSILPAYTRDASQWNEINWLFNNLVLYQGYTWGELQGAVWKILNNWDGNSHTNVPAEDSIVTDMFSDALLHSDFIPSCGEKAAVIFIPKGTRREAALPNMQVVFTMINI